MENKDKEKQLKNRKKEKRRSKGSNHVTELIHSFPKYSCSFISAWWCVAEGHSNLQPVVGIHANDAISSSAHRQLRQARQKNGGGGGDACSKGGTDDRCSVGNSHRSRPAMRKQRGRAMAASWEDWGRLVPRLQDQQLFWKTTCRVHLSVQQTRSTCSVSAVSCRLPESLHGPSGRCPVWQQWVFCYIWAS